MALSSVSRSQNTKKRILEAARALFSSYGYDATTIRQIATEAQANVALINRYYGSKENLFAESAEFNLQLPALERVERSNLGEHLVSHFFTIWEDNRSGQQLIALLKASSSQTTARTRMQEVFEAQLIQALIKLDCNEDTVRARAALIASQMLGLAMVRYVLMLEMGNLERETLIRVLGKTIQEYLTSPL